MASVLTGVPGTGPPIPGSSEAHEPDATTHALLAEARRALGMSVAFVSRFVDGRQVIDAVDATCPVPFGPGDSAAAEQSYCQRVVDGRLAEAIPDTSANPVTAQMPLTAALGIGSYVGVPILLSDGTVYGSLCAYSHEPKPVDERDSAILTLVARSLSQQLSECHDRAAITARLAALWDDGGLHAHYQPIVELSSGATVGLEALARFPSSFGRRTDQWFTDAVLVGQRTRLEMAAIRCATEGLQVMPLGTRLSLNVSPATVVEAAFLDWLSTAPQDRLVLELTEHVEISDYSAVSEALAPAREAGLQLAVDDAGAGYASMRHVLLLQPDILKLDISLVHDLDVDARKRSLCRAIVGFADSLGTTVVAEGVETAAELRAVRRLGVEQAQGYHLSRPLPLDEVRWAGYGSQAPDAPASTITREVATLIQEMSLSGASPSTIAARLNRLGEQTPRGVRWHQVSVGEELRRQASA